MKLLSVLKKDLKILLKDRGQLAALFLAPLAFILPISFAMGAVGGLGPSDEKEPLPVLDYDGGSHAQSLIESLEESVLVEQNLPLETAAEYGLGDDSACAQVGQACDERVFTAMLERSNRTAVLIIPAGFSEDVDAREYTSLTLRYDPVGDVNDRQRIEGVIKGQAVKLSLEKVREDTLGDFETLTVFAPDDLQEAAEKEADKPADPDREPAFDMESVHPSSYTLEQTPDAYQQNVPGYTVMFVFFIVGYVSSAIHEEKISGTFRRLLSVPVSRAALLGGKLLSVFIVGVLQVAVMFAVGALVFALDLGRDWIALALLTMVLAATAATMGLAAAALRISSEALTPPLIIFALVGGCMLPLDMMPFLRPFSVVVPHSWALNGYQNLIVRGQGLLQVLPQIGVLMAFTLVFFVIAVWRFDFED